MDKQKISVPKATLDFYVYEKDGLRFYEFDATSVSAPEPMINAFAGLAMLKRKNDRLVGRFFHKPLPLLQRISNYFDWEEEEMENGDVRLTFRSKNNSIT